MKKVQSLKATLTVLFLVCALVKSTNLLAQQDTLIVASDTSYWDKGGVINLTFNQVTLSNWAAGGLNTVSVSSLLSLFANYEKGKTTWSNNFDIGYGITQQGDNAFLKNDDKIELVSKYGSEIAEKISFSGVLNFRTQMAPGFQFPENDSVRISDFMAPGYLIGALGLEYKPSKMFMVSLSPVSSKVTFVLDQTFADAGNFGVEAAEIDTNGNVITPGKNIRVEVGGLLRANFKKEIMKNVVINSKIDLFSNYIVSPENIDVNWETLIVMKINKYLSANFGLHLIYDDDIDIEVDENNDGVIDAVGPRLQVKQVFGAGLNIKF